ncbi:methylated-DNA--[protein]-cysteine S-methyltransferase [Thermospira aquatica]|uniref:methylated-DNA--[protein]-cysteine S-methyltransferase n=1 Tax=Thermospira aquatica TaxID=2828656 RepID=A0AAX3BCR1_9SPIR|nr:methylated-DNA--[protein]-cysteine S-methyltransferase [Thermospira aquatica]URA10017.1 methylated-DNA--[protein]-cysteine S-methyltransferase [Thermospira aquatica]
MWIVRHHKLTVFFTEENNMLQSVRLSLLPASLPPSYHPFCEIFENYLNGKQVSWPAYNQELLTPFQKLVFAAVVTIPYGETRTYKEVASMIGRPKAYRAVAQALKHNPFPLVIPCHRVVSSNFPQDIGGYTPDPEIKKILLTLEGVLF